MFPILGSFTARPVGDRIDWPIALCMALAGVVGGFLGMVTARRIKPDQLRAVILTIGVLLTVVYFVRNYGLATG